MVVNSTSPSHNWLTEPEVATQILLMCTGKLVLKSHPRTKPGLCKNCCQQQAGSECGRSRAPKGRSVSRAQSQIFAKECKQVAEQYAHDEYESITAYSAQ